MKVVLYSRVSSEESAEKDLSIPAQRKALEQYALRMNCDVLRSFCDEGISAYAPADRRPGFTDMIAFCRRTKVNAILVHKLDRFSRHREESVLFKSLLRRHGVVVRSVTENYDPDTPQGFLYEGMIEVINQFYSMNLATEVRKGLKENTERGNRNGARPPYGYRIESWQEGARSLRKLVPGPVEEVETVKEIYHSAVEEGLGMRRIAGKLNRAGRVGPLGGPWTSTTVGEILRNPVYVGDLVWGRVRTSRKKHVAQPREEWVVTRDTHEPLVSRELYERRQEIARGQTIDKPNAVTSHARSLLARVIRCGNCGLSFVAKRQHYKTPRGLERFRSCYYCTSYLTKGVAVCPCLPILEDWADNVVIEGVRERLSGEGLVKLRKEMKESLEEVRRTMSGDVKDTERRIQEIGLRIQRYYEAIGQGMDPTICRGFIADLEAERARLQSASERERLEQMFVKGAEDTVRSLEQFAQTFETEFETLTPQVQRQLILSMVQGIDVIDRKIFRVRYNIPLGWKGRPAADDTRTGTRGMGEDFPYRTGHTSQRGSYHFSGGADECEVFELRSGVARCEPE